VSPRTLPPVPASQASPAEPLPRRRVLTLRAAALVAAVLIPIGVGLALLTFAGQDLHRAVTERREGSLRMLVATDIGRRVAEVQTGVRGLALLPSSEVQDGYREALATLPILAEQLRGLTSSRVPRERIERVLGPVEEYLESTAKPLREAVARLGQAAATRAALLADEAEVDAIRGRIEEFVAEQREAVVAATRDSDESASRSETIGIVGLLALPVIALLALALFSRFVSRPLRRIADAADRLRGGDPTARVPEGGAGEVGQLAGAFNAMADSLQRQQDDLARAARRAEDAARLNGAILDASRDGYLAVDEDGVALAYTPSAGRAFGHPPEAVLGNVLADVVLPPEARPAHHQRRRALFANGTAIPPYRVWVRRADGRRALVEIAAAPVTANAKRMGVYFVHDVTEEVLREEERRAEEAVTRVLVDADRGEDLLVPIVEALGKALGYLGGTFWEYSERDRTLSSNDAWALTGEESPRTQRLIEATRLRTDDLANSGPIMGAWRSDDPTWALVEDVYVADVRESLLAGPMRSVIALPVPFAGQRLGVISYGTADEEPPDEARWLALRSLTSLVGQVVGRRRAEQESERFKNEFFALLSHELRTPLTSVVGYLDMVRDEEVGPLNEEQSRFLGIVDRNAHRLMRLVGDLLFSAQIESGRLQLEPQRTRLEAVVQEALDAAQPRASGADVRLVSDLSPVQLRAGDADRLGQLVDNLVSNAIKFTPSGGTVRVSLREEEDRAVIEVADDGPGIAAGDQERLFDRFFRTAEAQRDAIPGLGLGLSIARAIAEGHGGTLAVESVLGHGATFRVELPADGAPVVL
jgi:PAS domain S-box-containing protein